MRKVIIFLTSIFGWLIIFYLIIPLITAIVWLIWSIFIYRKLFIKEEFRDTLYALLILLIISIIYFIVLKIWVKYNYKTYYLKNKRNIIQINFEHTRPCFKKLEYSEEEIDEFIKLHCNTNNT